MADSIELIDRSEYIGAMKNALEIDVQKTAVLTIDMQRKYLDQEVGASSVDAPIARRLVDAHQRLLSTARGLGVPVVHAYVVRRADELDGSYPSGFLSYVRATAALEASQLPGREGPHPPDRVAGSPEAELMQEVVAEGDFQIPTKKSWDSFQYTDLDHLLRWTLKVDTLLMTGVNTDTCVYSTVFSAGNLGYRPVVVSDCVASMRGDDSHRMALELMARSVAWVLTIDELLQKLPKQSNHI